MITWKNDKFKLLTNPLGCGIFFGIPLMKFYGPICITLSSEVEQNHPALKNQVLILEQGSSGMFWRSFWALQTGEFFFRIFQFFPPEKRVKRGNLALMRFYRWGGDTQEKWTHIIFKNFLWAFQKCLKKFSRPNTFFTIGH